ncbi:Pyridoxine/pyridoxamine 5'-phosphate oxidase 1, chloroplastic-like protein [Drosera capensis]
MTRPFCSSTKSMESTMISYLSQRQAAEIDEELMGPLGFSVDQLMELAGLSVATAIFEVYKPSTHSHVLAICGPGNNGGDGLVAARHLYHFGYKLAVCYPKRTPKPLYSGLVTQLESLHIPFLSVDDLPSDFSNDFDIVIDAMFGFSFHGTPRPPFDVLIQRLVVLHNHDHAPENTLVIVSVDIPSGWHVEGGDISGDGIKPDMLVCSVWAFSSSLPWNSICVRIGKPPQVDISALRENYVSPALLEEQVQADPFDQFRKWFDDAVAAGLREPNAMALSTTGKDGKPSSRMVLLKGIHKDGFVWYTNYESKKASQLSENPRASLLFYWNDLNRQTWPWAVCLSDACPGFRSISLIPKPKYWGGYRLKPELFEFWQGQTSRLHDRLHYTEVEINGRQTWRIDRLAP